MRMMKPGRVAKRVSIPCLSTVNLLVLLKQGGHIMLLEPVFRTMENHGFHIAGERVDAALKEVGERPCG